MILISSYTGIRSELIAEKILEAVEAIPDLRVPVVVRLQGLNQELAEAVLANAASPLIKTAAMLDDAVELAVSLAGGR